MITKVEQIIVNRTAIGDRIDRMHGAFTRKALLLHEENMRRMKEEIRREVKK